VGAARRDRKSQLLPALGRAVQILDRHNGMVDSNDILQHHSVTALQWIDLIN
jgi:hypothetical protein